MSRRSGIGLMRWRCFLACGALFSGCGDETKIPTTVEQVKQTVAPTVETAVKTVEPPKFEINPGTKLEVAACYAVLIPASGDRPAYLQISTYKNPSEENFPSIFLRAAVANGSNPLAGQSLSAQLWVQQVSGGPVLYTGDSQPLSIQINKAAEQKIEGTIAAGNLTNSESSQSIPFTGGQFRGSLE